MVKYYIEDFRFSQLWHNKKLPPHLVVETNEITEEMLVNIDMDKTPYIIFRTPVSNGNKILDLKIPVSRWTWLTSKIKYLWFHGVLVEKQFTCEHFEHMSSLIHLHIGGTTYPLFENEDISKLPIVRELTFDGSNTVKKSESLEKWIRIIKLNQEANSY